MEPMNPKTAMKKASALVGKEVYIHFEINPNGYWRNGKATLKEVHIKGDGPYRVFLVLDDGLGLIQLNGLTHMESWNDAVIFTGYDDQDRIEQTIEISTTPFSM